MALACTAACRARLKRAGGGRCVSFSDLFLLLEVCCECFQSLPPPSQIPMPDAHTAFKSPCAPPLIVTAASHRFKRTPKGPPFLFRMSSSERAGPTPPRSKSSGNLRKDSGSNDLRFSVGSALESGTGRDRRQSEGAHLGEDDSYDSAVDILGTPGKKRVNLTGLFGIRPYAGHTEARGLSERSEKYQKLERPINRVPDRDKERYVNWSTVLWLILFGWWSAVPYACSGAITFLFAPKQGKRLLRRALYVAWPFGRFIERKFDVQQSHGQGSASAVLSPSSSKASSPRSSKAALCVSPPPSAAEISLSNQSFTEPLLPAVMCDAREAGVGAGAESAAASISQSLCNRFGLMMWYLFVAPPLSLLHLLVAAICVFTVVLIPMAKMNMALVTCLWDSPLNVRVGRVEPKSKNRHVVHCTFSAGSVYWFKYSVGGANIFILNMLVVVLAVTVVPYLLPHESLRTPTASVAFIITALSTIIPLGYLIVQAIASISAQTNFALGAVLNAFFGTIIEVILYAGAMNKPDTGSELVCQGIIGALLCALIMIPGLCMIIGGIRHKEQKFNRVSAGVSSLLLFVALIGVFTPTLFQRVYGGYELKCSACYNSSSDSAPTPASSQLPARSPFALGATKNGDGGSLLVGVNCRGCSYLPTAVIDDSNFKENTWPLSILVAVFLPAIYIIGLIFTLRTHSSYVDHEEQNLDAERLLPTQDEGGGADVRDASESVSHDEGGTTRATGA